MQIGKEISMSDGSSELDFVAFYDQFLPQVYRYVRYRVVDTPTAEDLTSAVFEKALRSWDKLRNPDAMASWIFRIAHNTVVSHYRWRDRWLEIPLDNIQDKISTTIGPETRVLCDERWGHIRNSISRLSSREQHIIALKFGGGLTNRAIASIVNTSEGNIAIILYRAMRKLRADLEGNQVPATTSKRRISYD